MSIGHLSMFLRRRYRRDGIGWRGVVAANEVIAPRDDQLLLIGAERDLHNFGGGRDVVDRLRRIVDVPQLELLVAAARGEVLLVRIQSDRSDRADVSLELANQRAATCVPALHDSIFTNREVLG